MSFDTNRLTLFSTFSARGEWWLPSKSELRVGGTLSYSPDGIVLDLHGSLLPTTLAQLAVVPTDVDWIPIIHGRTDCGLFTLVRAFVTDFDVGEIMHSSLSAIYLVLGSHVIDPDLPSISLSFTCNHLDEFVGAARFEVEEELNGDEVVKTTVRHVLPEPRRFSLDSEATQIEIEQSLSCSDKRTTISLTASHTIAIRPSTPQTFQWIHERVGRMCYLLTLLTDEEVRPQRIMIRMNEEELPRIVFYAANRGPNETRKPASRYLFYIGHILDQFGAILSKWFAATPPLTNAIHLFMDGQHVHGSFEGRFLTLCQSFEAFSRATSHSEYMVTSEYAAVQSQLIAAIPQNVATDHRESLKTKIKFGNEHSLRKRLTKAVESLLPEALVCVTKSTKLFVGGIVDTRNHLIHSSDQLREAALRGTDLHRISEQLAMLLRILLLREIGIETSQILIRIRNHSRLLQDEQLYHSRENDRRARVQSSK
jgi:hypothetical protein